MRLDEPQTPCALSSTLGLTGCRTNGKAGRASALREMRASGGRGLRLTLRAAAGRDRNGGL